jgi:cell division inhibitor SulA
MGTILALDLGKFKSVAIWYDSVTHAERAAARRAAN